MESKRIIYLLMFVGGALGGYVPLIWGANYFSFSSILFNALGAMLGIWIGFKINLLSSNVDLKICIIYIVKN